MVVALALLTLVVGVVIPAVGRQAGVQRERESLRRLLDVLASERVLAMREAERRSVEISLADQDFVVVTPDGRREWSKWPIPLVTVDGEPAASAAISFAPSGRTSVRRLVFGTEAGGRIWTLAFDPISGQPNLTLGRESNES